MTPLKKMSLYVMSGTGNTYRMAIWIKNTALLNGLSVELNMIDEIDVNKISGLNSKHLVGILFPAHGFMPPWSMIKFLFKMPSGKGAKAFCAATRGAIPVGKFMIPGAVGLGNFIAALILLIKRYRVKAMFSVDMPQNFINLFPGLNPKNISRISLKAKEKTEPVMLKILKGKSVFFTLNNLWDAIWGFPLIFLIPVFPILYLLIGRIFMGKMMFYNNQCIGCNLCSKICPNNAIVMKDVKKSKRPYWTYQCEACLRCMGYCDKKAIEAGHLWAVILYFITSIPLITWLVKWINKSYSLLPQINNFWLNELINVIFILPAMIISYWFFWNLIRIPIMNKIFTHTSLTQYFRRYHEPETPHSELKKY